MAEVVGLISSIAQILGALIAGHNRARRGQEIVEKLERVKEQVQIFEITFRHEHCRSRFSGQVRDVAESRLREVEQILDSIKKTLPAIPPNSTSTRALKISLVWYGMWRGSNMNKKLDEVRIKLGSLFQEIVLIMQPTARYPPNTLLPYPNPISTGLDRAITVLQFLSTLSPQSTGRSSGLYVVGIVGQGGLGKYTLLSHIIGEMHAFDVMAYAELVGDNPDNKALRELQTSLLWQLGGPHKEFQSVQGGKSDLRGRFLPHNDVQVVGMHDLIRKLAATKRSNSNIVIWNPDSWSTSLLSEARICRVLRFLCLDVEKAEEAQLDLTGNCFTRMQKLQVLALCGSFKCAQMRLPKSLQFMRLERNHYLLDIMIPCRLQQLELKECGSLVELPSSLQECEDLRYLCIVGCPKLQGFGSCRKWQKLSRLWLEGCASIIRLPEELAELKWLSLINCGSLQHLPLPYSKLESQNVHIHGCPCKWPPTSMPIQALPIAGQSSVAPLRDGSTTSLMLPQALPKNETADQQIVILPPDGSASSRSKKLDLSSLLELQSLAELDAVESLTIRKGRENEEQYWQALAKMVSLKKLRLRDCEWSTLQELAADEMSNLTKLKFNYCKLLEELPNSICKLDSLVMLSLRGCLQLQELPEEIGSLTALEVLDLHECQCLRRLPNSLCRMESLRELDMSRCSQLERLPHELGNLGSLRKLRISNCSSLTRLPDSMCELVSLKELDVTKCSKLEVLPDKMGNLSSLKKLQMGFCSSLQRLPHSICDLAHLFIVLDLEGCTHLSDVPEEILRVSCLRI